MQQHKTAYCASCGWNLAIAIRNCKENLTISAGVAALGVVLSGVTWLRGSSGFSEAAMMGSVFIALPASFGFVAIFRQSRLKKLETTLGELPAPQPIVPNNEPTPLGGYQLQLEMRPRQVRLLLHVFYDRDDPRRSVALEGSLYRVK
jgi:hypothetical protein